MQVSNTLGKPAEVRESEIVLIMYYVTFPEHDTDLSSNMLITVTIRV